VKVLVVDDSLTMRKIVVHILRKLEGVETVEAEDGYTGLSKLDTEDFDLLITDWNMPGMDGLEMVRQARLKGHDKLAVIMLTSNGSPWELIQAYRVGVDGFVTKPMTPGLLRHKIATVMSRKNGLPMSPSPRESLIKAAGLR